MALHKCLLSISHLAGAKSIALISAANASEARSTYLHLSGNTERFTHDLRARGIMVISTLLDVLVQGDDSSYPNLTCMALRKYKRQFL